MTKTAFINITLNSDNLSISYERIKTLDKIEIDSESETLYFREISLEQLKRIRESTLPALILKMDERFFFCKVPYDLDIFSSDAGGKHQCADCNRCSAASDEDGGCQKVRELKNRRIENYNFVTKALQTVHTKHDTIRILGCANWEAYPSRKKRPYDEIRKAKIALAQFVWPDVETIEEVRRRKKRNKNKQNNS